ncbi:MAG: flavin reductase family protein [Nitrososphaerota archaeon]|nr:flavin reductase family protein [Nitrososphaerota archaeon]
MKNVDPSLVHRLFYPSVPALLCAAAGGRAAAMPVVSYLSISSDPPLLGVACATSSFTMKMATTSKSFTLCFMDRRYVGKVAALAVKSGRYVTDKIAAAGLSHRPGRSVKAPVISEAMAVIECTLDSRRRFGDHWLLVGRVRAVYASTDFRDYWRFEDYRPILYTGWAGGMKTFPTDH